MQIIPNHLNPKKPNQLITLTEAISWQGGGVLNTSHQAFAPAKKSNAQRARRHLDLTHQVRGLGHLPSELPPQRKMTKQVVIYWSLTNLGKQNMKQKCLCCESLFYSQKLEKYLLPNENSVKFVGQLER